MAFQKEILNIENLTDKAVKMAVDELVVPKLMTVEAGHTLAHQISAEIEKCLSYSHILVHIDLCPGACDTCAVECQKIYANFQTVS